MKLSGVELVQVELPFRQAIGTAAGAHRVRPLLFVRVVADEAEGWGECGALADGTAVDPALADGAAGRRGPGRAPPPRGQPRPGAASSRSVREWRSSSGARRSTGCSPPPSRWRSRTPSCASRGVPWPMPSGSPPASRRCRRAPSSASPRTTTSTALRRAVDAAVEAGAARVRLKIEPGWELEPVRAVRADHPDLVLQVDANGSFTAGAEDVAVLSGLADFDVLCIEQPLPPADLVAHAQLARAPPGAHLPGRVALLAAAGQRRPAQRRLRHGLPQAGPARGRAGHPGCARRLCRRRRARLRRWLLRGGAGPGGEPRPGRPAGPGRDGPGQ